MSNSITDFPKICAFFVTRKSRNCRMLVVGDSEFCPEHDFKNTNTNEDSKPSKKRRIACPLDNKHTCYEGKLQKHLRVCNARKDDTIPYISWGINSGKEIGQCTEITNDLLLFEVPVTELKILIDKIHKIYEEYVENIIVDKFLVHEIVQKEIDANPEYGAKTRKHLVQSSAILGTLNKYNFLKSDTCFVEFGAGKGQLSYWIYKAVESINNTSVLLVERASQRHKFDNKLDDKDSTRVHRIRADISDLVLNKIEFLDKSKHIVGVAKHLCGNATDLAIRCLTNCKDKNIFGLVMAFCCHHKCDWTSYTGKVFFNNVDLNNRDFNIMSRLVSWATCSIRENHEKKCDSKPVSAESDGDTELVLSKGEKEKIGRQCKNIIDYGRLQFLKELGYTCCLQNYVNSDISLENVCIVAYKNDDVFL